MSLSKKRSARHNRYNKQLKQTNNQTTTAAAATTTNSPIELRSLQLTHSLFA